MEALELYNPPSLKIVNSVTVKLTERNYLLWKNQFEAFLNGQRLLGFVTGEIPQPTPTLPVPGINGTTTPVSNPDHHTWFQTDQVIKSWLLGSFSEDIQSLVVSCSTSHQIWVTLGKHYNRPTSSRLFELQRKLQTVSKQAKTMTEYLTDIKLICDQLASIESPVTERMKIFATLQGLGKEYEPLITSIEGAVDMLPDPTLEDILPRLHSYEARIQRYNTSSDVSPHLAFNVERSNFQSSYYNSRGRGQSNGRFGRGRGRGHFSTRGRGFHQQLSSSGFRSGSSASSVSSDDRPSCQICGRYGHTAMRCWHRFNNSYQEEELPMAMAAMHITDVTDHAGAEWFADSAATSHITSSPHHLANSHPYRGNDAVMIGDGNFLPITHVGSTDIASTSGTSLPLKDVLVCPGIAKSLLSVSKLTNDYPCSFEFDDNRVFVKDKQTKRVLRQGSTREGLYSLKSPKPQALYSTRQISTSDEVWHRRLGHPHDQVLKYLNQIKSIAVNKSSLKICESCQLGKSSRLPFVASSFVASRPLERVHCDLWGPSPVTSNQGFRFYVIFVDNFSRFSWLFPLKAKSDFYNTFIMFQKMIENQLSTKISMFQCDGGGEFMSNKFLSHLKDCGIQQLVSCPYTPQQNGLAERKHRHLTELSLTMLFQSKTPQRYWVEVFYTANFLINLLPSSVLEDKRSPFEVLHGKAPDYSALRTFGCSCYPMLRDYAATKFDPRSLRCVFLGYNDKYKGYRCLYPPTGRVYISRHVIFDELSFPFETIYKDAHPQIVTPSLGAWQRSFMSSESEQSNKSSTAEGPVVSSNVLLQTLPPQRCNEAETSSTASNLNSNPIESSSVRTALSPQQNVPA